MQISEDILAIQKKSIMKQSYIIRRKGTDNVQNVYYFEDSLLNIIPRETSISIIKVEAEMDSYAPDYGIKEFLTVSSLPLKLITPLEETCQAKPYQRLQDG